LDHYTPGQRLVGSLRYTSLGGSQSRIFLRSDASRPLLGTLVGIFFSASWWDSLVGRLGKTFSTTLRISLVLSLGSGHRLFTTFMVGQRRGGLATSVMSSRLPCYFASNEESKRIQASSRSKSRLWRGIDGKICGLLCKRRVPGVLDAKCDVVYRLISYTSDWC